MENLKKWLANWLVFLRNHISNIIMNCLKNVFNTIAAILIIILKSFCFMLQFIINIPEILLSLVVPICILLYLLSVIETFLIESVLKDSRYIILCILSVFASVFFCMFINGVLEWWQYCKNRTDQNAEEQVSKWWHGHKLLFNCYWSFISLLALWASINPTNNYGYLTVIRTYLEISLKAYDLDINNTLFMFGITGFCFVFGSELYEYLFRDNNVVKSIWDSRFFKDNK